MKILNAKGLALGASVAALSLTACVEGAPVDHETTSQAIQDNSQNIEKKVSQALKFLEASEMFNDAWGAAYGGGGTTVCVQEAPEEGESPGEPECETMEEEPPTFDAGVTEDGRKMLVKMLNERVFTSENVETQTRKSVTYRLKGKAMCDREDFMIQSGAGCAPVRDGGDTDGGGTTNCTDQPPQTSFDKEGYQNCLSTVNKAELRIKVTSPEKGDLNFRLLVGPDRYNPGDLELHSDKMAVEADLADIKASTSYLSTVLDGEDVTKEWPQTMRGRMRGELRINGSQAVEGTFGIVQAVRIAGGDYDVSIGKAQPALRLAADGAKKMLEGEVSFGTIDATFPQDVYQATHVGEPREPERAPQTDGGSGSGSNGNDNGGPIEEPDSKTFTYKFHLAGLSGKSVFQAGNDSLTVTGVGLGGGTSTLDIEGKRVIEVDLNKGAGRSFDVTLVPNTQDDSYKVSVSPKFDLSVLLKFARVKDKLENVDAWAHDNLIEATLDGADPAELELNDDGLEVLTGMLTLSSKNDTLKASAGQCVIGDGEDAPKAESGSNSGDDSGQGDEETDRSGSADDEPATVFGDLKVQACGQ